MLRRRSTGQPEVAAPASNEPPGLTPEEDAELRRLCHLEVFGDLDPAARSRIDDLRRRDRREAVREADDPVTLVPRPRGGRS